MKICSVVQTWTSHLVYILPTGQAQLAPWQTLAIYILFALVFFTTTLVFSDFGQEVPHANQTTVLEPQITFHVLVQPVGHVEDHLVLTL